MNEIPPVILVVIIVVAVLLCFYVFCCYLPQLPEGWEYHDRAHIDEYTHAYGYTNNPVNAFNNNAGGEGNPEQEQAMGRINHIRSRVIEKRVLESTEMTSASRQKSNLYIRVVPTSLRHWMLKPPTASRSVENKTTTSDYPVDTPPDNESAPHHKSVVFEEDDGKPMKSTADPLYEKHLTYDDARRHNTGTERKDDLHIQRRGRGGSRRASLGQSLVSIRSRVSNVVTKKSMALHRPEKCFICLDEYEVGEKIYWSPNNACLHSFHAVCMFQWLQDNDECPLCRSDFLLDSGSSAA